MKEILLLVALTFLSGSISAQIQEGDKIISEQAYNELVGLKHSYKRTKEELSQAQKENDSLSYAIKLIFRKLEILEKENDVLIAQLRIKDNLLTENYLEIRDLNRQISAARASTNEWKNKYLASPRYKDRAQTATAWAIFTSAGALGTLIAEEHQLQVAIGVIITSAVFAFFIHKRQSFKTK